jgi:hypothetical protein
MAKFRKHPTGQWPFYPRLKDEDIQHEYWRSKKMYMKSFITDRMGRIVVTMDGDSYDEFLDAVRKKKGNIWASSIDEAMREAMAEWVAKEDK